MGDLKGTFSHLIKKKTEKYWFHKSVWPQRCSFHFKNINLLILRQQATTKMPQVSVPQQSKGICLTSNFESNNFI